MSAEVILPGTTATGQQTTLGVMGGGQLGRMFVQAAQSMGYFTAVLDPDPASPAGLVSHFHIQTDYLDEQGLAQLMQRCAAITTEFENVPAPALFTLGAHRRWPPAPTRWPSPKTASLKKPISNAAACRWRRMR
jgi:5-(carboxyamino)imidazole ribonucleotide synthase